MLTQIKQKLEARLQSNLRRNEFVRTQAPGVRLARSGNIIDNFTANDYLGLANDDTVKQIHQANTATWGLGSGASRLLSGTSSAHTDLEQHLAKTLGFEAACLFTCGYMANLAIIQTLFGPTQLILHDRANHASLIDATTWQKQSSNVLHIVIPTI